VLAAATFVKLPVNPIGAAVGTCRVIMEMIRLQPNAAFNIGVSVSGPLRDISNELVGVTKFRISSAKLSICKLSLPIDRMSTISTRMLWNAWWNDVESSFIMMMGPLVEVIVIVLILLVLVALVIVQLLRVRIGTSKLLDASTSYGPHASASGRCVVRSPLLL
jgi:hypothetical protein